MTTPLEGHGVIGNCKTLALVACDGAIDWMCLPHFSGPSLFARLLDDERGGSFAITPRDVVSVTQRYVENTNVLCTEFRCRNGVLQLTDAMTIAPPGLGADTALAPAHELIRSARCTEGEVELDALYEPRPGYACSLPRLTQRGRLGWQCTGGAVNVHLLTDLAFETAGAASLRATERLRAGERRQASLTSSGNEMGVIPPLGDAMEQRLQGTIDWWRGWCALCKFESPHAAAVMRSALALKLLTYCLSGAVVAAGTTSMPIGGNGKRNWDYRYCWLRDTSLVLQSFDELGHRQESSAFLAWLLHATRLTQPELQVVYDVYGESRLSERNLPHLRGHAGLGPVRIGNAASQQRQLDVYGELVVAAYDFVLRGGTLESVEQSLLAGFANTAASVWREPDQGIWEVRTPPRHNTYSKLMCWAALDRSIQLHERIGFPVDAERLRGERAAIREDIDRHAYNAALGGYVGVYGGSDADASLLLMPRLGYLDARDVRMTGTLRLVEQQLGHDGLLYRYPPGPTYDGVEAGEALFIICSFWRVECLALQGRVDEAEALFQRLLSLRNPVGLYSEELDAASFRLQGNFPQAFSHVGLITAALAIERARP